MAKRAVFLDRDGVINQTIFRDGKARAPDHLHQFEFLPGVPAAIAKLKEAGFLTIVVTNQPDVARGWQQKHVVEAMNEKVMAELQVDDLKTCFHDDEHDCLCRKPKPGMLEASALEWDIDLRQSFMIGDRLGDIQAGNAAGCVSILVGPGDSQNSDILAELRVSSLTEAAAWICGQVTK